MMLQQRRWMLVHNSWRCGINCVECDCSDPRISFTPGLSSAIKSVVVDHARRRIVYEPLAEDQQV